MAGTSDTRQVKHVRKKDVADLVRSVLQNDSEDIPDIESYLHKSIGRLEKSAHSEKEAMKDLLASNITLAKYIRRLADRADKQDKIIEQLLQGSAVR